MNPFLPFLNDPFTPKTLRVVKKKISAEREKPTIRDCAKVLGYHCGNKMIDVPSIDPPLNTR